ncbi:hypothetical protein PoB_007078400 [Plakobranchus ocellatus]|uniref:Uncharacterized protein n=1 Tax=Plakobranchus ocellatus TaxID=259542 RepID=A0AAV4DJR9_9GAST|nr:hypothetical protein PoB_007078400 [Plakobranchus ocellatus]
MAPDLAVTVIRSTGRATQFTHNMSCIILLISSSGLPLTTDHWPLAEGGGFPWCKEVGCPPRSDLRLSGPPSGQGACGRALTRNRKAPADLRADSLSPVPRSPQSKVDTGATA